MHVRGYKNGSRELSVASRNNNHSAILILASENNVPRGMAPFCAAVLITQECQDQMSINRIWCEDGNAQECCPGVIRYTKFQECVARHPWFPWESRPEIRMNY